MKVNKKIIFFGRYGDKYSNQIYFYLKSKFKNVIFLYCKGIDDNIDFRNVENIKADYIFCFRFLFLIPNKILKNTTIAINFHPGPPEYRGIGCVNFALYNNSKQYGVTAHLMNNKIDNGKILDVKRFRISKIDTVDTVLNFSYKLQVKQAKKIIKSIWATGNSYIKNLQLTNNNFFWSKNIFTRKQLNKLYQIPLRVSQKKLQIILRSTYTENFKPYIIFLGNKFIYEKQ
jgi:hypothetical protein